MGRYSSKNKVSKSSGLGKGPGKKGLIASLAQQASSNPVNLTPEQQSAIEKLKEELKYYQDERREVTNKRLKISRILDNFEKIIVGDILLDILPDENSDEIKNSPILTKSEVLLEINNANVPGLDPITRTLALNYINMIFKMESVKELTERSSELGNDELYSAILTNIVEDRPIPGVKGFIANRVKFFLLQIIDNLEDDLL
jgi:hypothetical protein